MRFFTKHYKAVLIILGLIVFGYWRINSAAQSNPLRYTAKSYSLSSPVRQDIQNQLVLAGKLDATLKANLAFASSGKLVWTGVKVGDQVRKWQAIASLDKEQLRKNLATQYNNYRTSLSSFNDVQDQYKQTREKVLVTDTIQRLLDRTQYSLDNAVINYEINDMAIKDATLISPLSGIVTNITVPVNGVNVTPLNAGFTIIDPNSIYFRSEIDQEDVTKIKINQTATLKLDSFPDQSYPSKIVYIAFTPVEGQTSTVYETRFEFPSPNNDLVYRLGMNGDATIVLAESLQALTVPTETINEDAKGKYVLIKTEAKDLVKKYIKTGIETDISTEILEGLSENDQVALKNKK